MKAKKFTIILVLIFLFLVATLMTGCSNFSIFNKEHDVILILVDGEQTKEVTLTSREKGENILSPDEYKIFPSLIKGYVVVDDYWYAQEDMNSNSMIYFPYTMPNETLKFYAKVRPLTKISDLTFANPDVVEDYFKSQSILYEDYLSPGAEHENSFYEIEEYSHIIKNHLRYYPVKKEIQLSRGYVQRQDMLGNSVMIRENEYDIFVNINLTQHTLTVTGRYKMVGMTAYEIKAYATVSIEFNINELSVDEITEPLLANFGAITYNYTIYNTSNYNKFKEMWKSDGYVHAKKCYIQADGLLKSLNNKITVLS